VSNRASAIAAPSHNRAMVDVSREDRARRVKHT
jgi:hypothetical protein